ncbi:retrovirus-related pol polyprotein from transposon TNT 1-94 [Tanacetum coccineum]
MEELKVDFRKLNTDDDRKSYYAEVKSIRSGKIDDDKAHTEPSNRPTNLKDKFEQLKRRIHEKKKEPITTHDKPKQQLQKVVSHEIKELPAHYSATLQNKLPPKETDPGSFILPCIIGNHSMSNALADLGASISIMPYSLFKRLGLGSLKPIKMTIEMADRSMQSPKGIKGNVLVKISNFIFPVDFFILDIMEDENVPIILGRPMLETAHAKIDVYSKKISLGVGNDQRIAFPGYNILDLVVFVVIGECRHRYAVSSLMDTAYWSSE